MSFRALLRPRERLRPVSDASVSDSGLTRSTRELVERPASDALIRAAPLAEILEPHRALQARIRIAYGGEEGGFETWLAPLVRRYAAFVHLLPATADAHFREPGGLLRLGLEVGLHAVQAADGQLFAARGTVTERRALAPRWRTAAFLAGLCADLNRAISTAAIIADDGARWLPLRGPLADWLAAGDRAGYVVHWPRSHEPVTAAGLIALPHLVDAALAEFLAASQPCLVTEVIAALSGDLSSGYRPLRTIVEQTLARIADRDLRERPSTHAPSASAPVVPDTDSIEKPPSAIATTELPPDSALKPLSEPADGGADDEASKFARRAPDAASDGVSSEAAAPFSGDRRALAIPATVHPVVAEALSVLFEDPAGGRHVVTPQGIFVPLSSFMRLGLDTGLAVRALHDAGLLVTERGRKVRSHGEGASSEPGVLLNPRIIAAQASLPFRA